jgi:hypothetical protein
MTDAETIANLMDTQRELARRLERIAGVADIYAEQVGQGPLTANLRFAFQRIAGIARTGVHIRGVTELSLETMGPLFDMMNGG